MKEIRGGTLKKRKTINSDDEELEKIRKRNVLEEKEEEVRKIHRKMLRIILAKQEEIKTELMGKIKEKEEKEEGKQNER